MALEIARKYNLQLSGKALELLGQETPKTLDNVTTVITGSVRELAAAAAKEAKALGYEPMILTDQLSCEARDAGIFLAGILRTHAREGRKLAFIAGGETVVHLTGKGLGGRNQELALAAAPLTQLFSRSAVTEQTGRPTRTAAMSTPIHTRNCWRQKFMSRTY